MNIGRRVSLDGYKLVKPMQTQLYNDEYGVILANEIIWHRSRTSDFKLILELYDLIVERIENEGGIFN